jgi:hypothetical protein
MVHEPVEVEQPLIDDTLRLVPLVFDYDGVPRLIKTKRVNPTRVFLSCAELTRHKANAEQRI